MGTDSLKLEFIQDFLAADLDESFIARLKKEVKDFCSSKRAGVYPLKTWESLGVHEREAFYETAEKQVQQGQTRSHDDIKKIADRI
ncbi:hypothetical protein [Parabacteroides sp.]